MKTQILVLDFGSQYTQLIARRIRELKVYCEIHPFDLSLDRIRELSPLGIVLSGGPSSCYDPGAPTVSPELFALGIPVLGICYGVQLMCKLLGGRVEQAEHREYGRAHVTIDRPDGLLEAFARGEEVTVWMSHGDRVEAIPPGFEVLGKTPSSPFAIVANTHQRLFGLQFHPEVAHTPRGIEILSSFVFGVCAASPTWTMASYAVSAVEALRERIGDARVILGLSGGVDSTVTAALLHRAIGPRLTCIFVDNGLLRAGERDAVAELMRTALGAHAAEGEHAAHKMDIRVVDARARFLAALAGVTEPERKRKIIGAEFVAVFEEESRQVEGARFLGQGTLYPDVIESVSVRGPSATIKTHHNVGGLPERMNLKLVEPLRELFKDEVRALGAELGLPRHVLWRHPFPGPGLAVRCLGDLTAERLEVLRQADAIFDEEIRAANLYDSIWQSFAVLLPVRTVGVMGDERTYAEVVALRAVHSQDGMTADWVQLPYDLLARVSSRIINEVRGVSRVVYDVSSKPPATIEWE